MSETILQNDTPAENAAAPKRRSTVKSTLISMAALMIIASVAVLLLALANAFFPKYVPKLDLETVTILNGLAPTGETDNQKALDEGYFVMAAPEDLDAWNKENGDAGNKVIAVYKAEKGNAAGTVFVETSTSGYKGAANPITAITGISADGKFVAMHIKEIFEDNYDPGDLAGINDALKGKAVVTDGDIKPHLTVSAGATPGKTAGGLAKAVTLAILMTAEVSANG